MNLTTATAAQFPHSADLTLTQMQGGGSDRTFSRITGTRLPASPLVLMTYTDARPDNLKFVHSTATLAHLGIRVPTIYAHNGAEKLIWLEDMGAGDLFSFRQAPSTDRIAAYTKALHLVSLLHRNSPDDLTSDQRSALEPPFDAALYQWEQDYFFDHLVTPLSDLSEQEATALRRHPDLQGIITELAAAPRRLVHRDFQSQNVLIAPDGEACLIDHQGLRAGLPEYDLASLLLDPYVDLPESERAELARIHEVATYGTSGDPTIARRYHLCAAQRLMQALGAYGNLGRNLGKPEFLAHIPTALDRLLDIAAQVPELTCLLSLKDRVAA